MKHPEYYVCICIATQEKPTGSPSKAPSASVRWVCRCVSVFNVYTIMCVRRNLKLVDN